jgi:hypothetical protein
VLPGTYVTAMARSSFGPHRAARCAEARASVVAFEDDEIPEEAVSGWGVLLRGGAAFMAAPELPDMHPRPGQTIAGTQFVYAPASRSSSGVVGFGWGPSGWRQDRLSEYRQSRCRP